MRTQTLSRRDRLTGSRSDDSRATWIPAGHWDEGFADAVCHDIEALRRLLQGWDQEGSPPIRLDVIGAACALVRALPENLAYRPRVVPMALGNLQLEWHHGQKSLELEFETATTVRYLMWEPSAGIEEEATFPATDAERAAELIRWFMSGTLA